MDYRGKAVYLGLGMLLLAGCSSSGGGRDSLSGDVQPLKDATPAELSESQKKAVKSTMETMASSNQSAYQGSDTNSMRLNDRVSQAVMMAMAKSATSAATEDGSTTVDETFDESQSCSGGGTAKISGKLSGTVDISGSEESANVKCDVNISNFKLVADECVETEEGVTTTLDGEILYTGTFFVNATITGGESEEISGDLVVKFVINTGSDGFSSTVGSDAHSIKCTNCKFELKFPFSQISLIQGLESSSDYDDVSNLEQYTSCGGQVEIDGVKVEEGFCGVLKTAQAEFEAENDETDDGGSTTSEAQKSPSRKKNTSKKNSDIEVTGSEEGDDFEIENGDEFGDEDSVHRTTDESRFRAPRL